MIRRRWLWVVGALAGLALLLPLLVLSLLVLVDHGWLRAPIQRWASQRLGRSVQFTTLSPDLVSRHPQIVIEGLRIGNPRWAGAGDMAQIDHLAVTLGLGHLLVGALHPTAIDMQGVSLHLIRLRPGHNNWTLSSKPGSGPAFAPLLPVLRFAIRDGRLDFRDYGRGLLFQGRFAHAPSGSMPFQLAGQGRLKGFPVSFATRGGALNGPAVGPPYPFRAHLVDGATILDAQGSSAQPFDLHSYDLAVSASGPNLADLGYLFNLITPNSGPFHLTTVAKSDGRHLGFETLKGRLGESDIAGWIRSDHESRREIRADLHAARFTRTDIDALLAPIPDRAAARSRSGILPAAGSSPWIFSDATFGLTRMRAADFDFQVRVDRLDGYALPLRSLTTRIDLDRGLLRFANVSASLYSGALHGDARLDARPATPLLSGRMNLTGARLAEIGSQPSASRPGRLDMSVDMAGRGDSLHAAASTTAGTLSVKVTGAAISRRAGWMLGGDLLRAAGASAGGQDLSVPCAVGDFSGADGILSARRIAVSTALGDATGQGSIDLGREQLKLVLLGQPLRRRLFQVAVPVAIEGSLRAPAVTLLPGRNARKLGLHGLAGVILSPVAAAIPMGKAPPARVRCP